MLLYLLAALLSDASNVLDDYNINHNHQLSHTIHLHNTQLDVTQHLLNAHHNNKLLHNKQNYNNKVHTIQTTLHNSHTIDLKLPQYTLQYTNNTDTDIYTQQQHNLYLLHIKPPITSKLLDELHKLIHPYTLQHYLPHNTYLASLSHDKLIQLQAHHSVLLITEYHDSFKLDTTLHNIIHDTEITHKWLTNRYTHNKNNHITDNNLYDTIHNKYFTLAIHIQYPSIQNAHKHLYQHVAPLHKQDIRLTQQIAQLWQNNINDMLHNNEINTYINVKVVNSETVHITVEAKHILHNTKLSKHSNTQQSLLHSIVNYIQQHPYVTLIQPKAHYRLNNKHAKRVVQSGHKQTTPVYDYGIYGDNQLIGIGDTGIDYDNCFFYDPDVELPVNKLDMKHRKIVYYHTVPVNPDVSESPMGPATDEEGHGTHTAGSVAGKLMVNKHVTSNSDILNDLVTYNGVAENAKLIVWDISNPNDENLYVPDDVYNDYLTLQHNLGAYVSSNSWGDDSGYYDIFTHDVDQFIYDKQNFALLIAGGNTGDMGTMTIGSPACGKNVITVGASLNSAESFFDLGYNSGVHVNTPQELIADLPIVPASFGPRFNTVQQQDNIKLVKSEPYNACSDITNVDNVRGNVVLIERGICSFVIKAENARKAGAAMMLVANNDQNEPEATTMGAEPPYNTELVCAMLNKRDSDILNNALSSNKQITLSYPVDIYQSNQNEANAAIFSGKGPTKDGRIKPDILAPGRFIRSIHSTRNTDDFICDNTDNGLEIMEGTSMATRMYY